MRPYGLDNIPLAPFKGGVGGYYVQRGIGAREKRG